MKKRIYSMALVLVMTISFCVGTAFAVSNSIRASLTLSSYGVVLKAGNEKGGLYIDYNVGSNKSASSIGVESIVVYKSDGSYVKTITGTTSNGLIRSNSSLHLDSYEFSVTSGVSYYAEVTVFAKVGTEYDSRTITTSTVKAP